MSKYSRSQEERIRQYFIARPGWEISAYYGSREKNAGDFLVRCDIYTVQFGSRYYRMSVRIDHKSTTSDSKLFLQKEWLPRLSRICSAKEKDGGRSKPLITFSFKNDRILWSLGYLSFDLKSCVEYKIKEGKASLGITRAKVLQSIDKPVMINFDGYMAHIMPLDNWLKEYE